MYRLEIEWHNGKKEIKTYKTESGRKSAIRKYASNVDIKSVRYKNGY